MQREMLRIASPAGRASRGSRRRAYVLNVSTSWRCASVQIVSNTRDDLPLPPTHVKATSRCFGDVDVDALEVVRAGASDLDGGRLRLS